jgi:hypothetical protein
VLSRWYVFLPIDPGYMYIYVKILSPVLWPEHYYAESTKHTILVDAFPEPFMPERCNGTYRVGRHTYSLSIYNPRIPFLLLIINVITIDSSI